MNFVTCLGSKKQNQQSSEEEEKKDGVNTSDSKNAQFSWQVIPGVPDAKVDNPEEYPPFVMKVVKVHQLPINQWDGKSFLNNYIKQGMDGIILPDILKLCNNIISKFFDYIITFFSCVQFLRFLNVRREKTFRLTTASYKR